jgi:hypothetical protein
MSANGSGMEHMILVVFRDPAGCITRDKHAGLAEAEKWLGLRRPQMRLAHAKMPLIVLRARVLLYRRSGTEKVRHGAIKGMQNIPWPGMVSRRNWSLLRTVQHLWSG